VTADVITIIIQIAGAALVGVSESRLAEDQVPPLTPTQANDILLAGLAVQVLSLTVYLILLAILLVRLARISSPSPQAATSSPTATKSKARGIHRFAPLYIVLVLSSDLVYTRTVFRLVESAIGVESAAMRSQPLFAALETVPIMVAVLLWTLLPLRYLLQTSPDTSEQQ
jgi:ABC-type uncharacterized transport system permease subunit